MQRAKQLTSFYIYLIKYLVILDILNIDYYFYIIKKMNNKNNNQKIKNIILGKKNIKENENGSMKNIYNNNKKYIESYNTKNKRIRFPQKYINLETNKTIDKKNNLSLFSFLSSSTNQEEILTNKSLKTTKETDNNQKNLKFSIINNNRKYFLQSKKIGSTKNLCNLRQKNNLELNKELDKFKNKIDGLIKVIEDFERNYIHSSKSRQMKEELNKIIHNKKYSDIGNLTIATNNNDSHCHASQRNIRHNHKKQIYYRELNNSTLNKEKENNKTMILKDHKFNLVKNQPHNIYSSTKNIKNNNKEIVSLKNDNNKCDKDKNIFNKKNKIKNSYNKKINHSSLLEVKPINIAKKNIVKEKKKNMNKNINKNKPLTHHYASKSNDMKNIESIYKEKKIKEKNVVNNNIYITPNNNKTPKIYKTKQKIGKMTKQKSNENNITNASVKNKNSKKNNI